MARYHRHIFYTNGVAQQKYTENADSLSAALNRELKWIHSSKNTIAIIEISKAEDLKCQQK